jgi:hypothetical protein
LIQEKIERKIMRVYAVLLVVALIIVGLPVKTPAFDFDDLEQVEQAEQDELLAKAGQAVRDWNFNEARDLLAKAKQKGFAPQDIEAVEQLIADNESAKAEQDRRAQEERQAQIAAQEAAQRRSAASSSGGGSGAESVQIEVSCRSPMCIDSNLQVSPASGSDGGHGEFDPDIGDGFIRKGFDNRLDGVYVYSVQLEPFSDPHVVCSGSFVLNGSENFVYLNFNTDCSDAGSSVQIIQ